MSGKSTLIDLISGTFAGMAQVIAGHPLDTLKVRLQVQGEGGNKKFNGALDCLRQTLRHEGFLALYKGSASPLVGAMAHNAVVFFTTANTKNMIRNVKYEGNREQQLTVFDIFCAGALAGVPISFVEGPVDLLKVKLQSQIGKGEYKNVFDAAAQIFRKYGVRGLYQGWGATTLRNVPCFGSYFAGFEWAVRKLSPDNTSTPPLYICFIAGAVAGVSFWGPWYPLETIKTRMQNDHSNPQLRKFRNSFDCLRKTISQEGAQALWKGFTPGILRAILVNACIFWAFTYVKRNVKLS